MQLTAYQLIIIFSTTIIISYFFNLYSKRSGIPAVLLLIGLGILINYSLGFAGFPKPALLLPILKVLGVIGLVLIVLEAALDLELIKEKVRLIVKSLLVAFIGLAGTSYFTAMLLVHFYGIDSLQALLHAIPLSILGSAVILPSIDDVEENKREFMIYESTFSDILGIIGFYSVLNMCTADSSSSVSFDVFGGLFITIVLSVLISYALIYVFQNIRGHVKLFLLIAILLLLYAVGKMLNLSSLIIILIFGMMLNNYKVFFKGKLKGFIDEPRVEAVLDDMKVITAETAFVVRTFFFIIFGWSVFLSDLFSLKVISLGCGVLGIIYIVRMLTLLFSNGKNIFPQLFLAPRGLITILLFFAIPNDLSVGEGFRAEFRGVLLFVTLVSCIVMMWCLMVYKRRSAKNDVSDDLLDGSSEKTEPLVENLDFIPPEKNSPEV